MTRLHTWGSARCICMWTVLIIQNFGGGGGVECKTRENSNFRKKGKMVISVKIQKLSRTRMTKRTLPLESSHEI